MRKLFFLEASILFLATGLFSQSIKITNPSGGQKWQRGGSYAITWKDSGYSKSRIANIKTYIPHEKIMISRN